jgi:hypothetical protein
MSTTRPPFPTVIDNSLMSAWRACPRKVFLEYFQHWKPRSLNVHLHAGGAYAKGLEVARSTFYLEGKHASESIEKGLFALLQAYGDFECPEDSPKSATRVAGAYEYYFTQYPMGSDAVKPEALPGGAKGIEFSFVEPIAVNHPVSGDPLLYSGRFDMLAQYAGGRYGEDDKTATQLGASWGKQWDLRSQFTGYAWGAKQGGFPLIGFIIRGVSILKTKYETQQAITYRPDWQIDRWYTQLLSDLSRMIDAWDEGYWDYNLDESCTHYGGCPFRKVCLSQDPTPWLEGDFERRRWDPVTRIETRLTGG